ncbi:MAG TPA: CRTAC1 family protein [Terriglobia bacterium]|nr:CRTAC1 family protein [Terriglobia bacterium]
MGTNGRTLPFLASRRRKLIVKYTLISVSLVSVASLIVVMVRNHPKPYAPGEKVEGITSELARSIPAGYQPVEFTNVVQQAGIDFKHFHGTRSTQLPEDMGSGAAWGDYDGDGFQDLYVCDIAAPLTASPQEVAASPGGNRLYRNNQNGTFTDVTQKAGVGFKGIGMGAAWADYDNDGSLDLVVTSYGRIMLFHNRGDGTFEDVADKVGLGKFQDFWAGASWADYDRDGNVDLYICGYVQYEFKPESVGNSSRQFTAMVPFMLNPSSYTPQRNLLFHNNGNGTFTEVAKRAGVDDPTGRSLSAAWADFDGDGWPDLYVANDISDNVMYLNRHNGRFEDISTAARVADYRGAMGLAVGDWNRDGDEDIFVTHWIAQENALYSNLRFTLAGSSKPGRLRFEDVADLEGVGQIGLNYIGWGTSFFDYNNDGLLDLFVVDGSTFQDEKDPTRLASMKNLVFWNKGPDEGFFDVSEVSGSVFKELRVGRGAAFADYDNDGDVDIFVVNYGERPWLLRNDAPHNNHWLKVRVKGEKSNRSAFGARVEIQTESGTQFQEIGSQPSYISQNALEAHFGLGSAVEVQRLRVRFPGGAVRELDHVPSNQTVLVDESAP